MLARVLALTSKSSSSSSTPSISTLRYKSDQEIDSDDENPPRASAQILPTSPTPIPEPRKDVPALSKVTRKPTTTKSKNSSAEPEDLISDMVQSLPSKPSTRPRPAKRKAPASVASESDDPLSLPAPKRSKTSKFKSSSQKSAVKSQSLPSKSTTTKPRKNAGTTKTQRRATKDTATLEISRALDPIEEDPHSSSDEDAPLQMKAKAKTLPSKTVTESKRAAAKQPKRLSSSSRTKATQEAASDADDDDYDYDKPEYVSKSVHRPTTTLRDTEPKPKAAKLPEPSQIASTSKIASSSRSRIPALPVDTSDDEVEETGRKRKPAIKISRAKDTTRIIKAPSNSVAAVETIDEPDDDSEDRIADPSGARWKAAKISSSKRKPAGVDAIEHSQVATRTKVVAEAAPSAKTTISSKSSITKSMGAKKRKPVIVSDSSDDDAMSVLIPSRLSERVTILTVSLRYIPRIIAVPKRLKAKIASQSHPDDVGPTLNLKPTAKPKPKPRPKHAENESDRSDSEVDVPTKSTKQKSKAPPVKPPKLKASTKARLIAHSKAEASENDDTPDVETRKPIKRKPKLVAEEPARPSTKPAKPTASSKTSVIQEEDVPRKRAKPRKLDAVPADPPPALSRKSPRKKAKRLSLVELDDEVDEEVDALNRAIDAARATAPPLPPATSDIEAEEEARGHKPSKRHKVDESKTSIKPAKSRFVPLLRHLQVAT